MRNLSIAVLRDSWMEITPPPAGRGTTDRCQIPKPLAQEHRFLRPGASGENVARDHAHPQGDEHIGAYSVRPAMCYGLSKYVLANRAEPDVSADPKERHERRRVVARSSRFDSDRYER